MSKSKARRVLEDIPYIRSCFKVDSDGELWRKKYNKWAVCPGTLDIARNRDNNKIDNLRAVTARQNACNATKGRNNTSGVVGLSWCSTYQKWVARITTPEKTHHIGCFQCKN